MASFTSAGDSTEIVMQTHGEQFLISMSGTYDMTILLQRKVGEGAWKTLKTYSTANDTVSEYWSTEGYKQTYRLIVSVDTSGTCVATLEDTDDRIIQTLGGGVGGTPMYIRQSGLDLNGKCVAGGGLVTVSADVTLTARQHAGKTMVLSNAAGDTVTLPAATGTGNVYRFFTSVTVTSNSNIIQVANATDEFLGGIIQTDADTADTPTHYPALDADGFDTITMDGSTTGGIKGDYIEIEDVASGMFRLGGYITGTGIVATPLSAAVS